MRKVQNYSKPSVNMFVWVVTAMDDETHIYDSYCVGVFTDREHAELAANAHMAYTNNRKVCTITEHEVNRMSAVEFEGYGC